MYACINRVYLSTSVLYLMVCIAKGHCCCAICPVTERSTCHPGFLGPKIEVFFAEKNFLVLNAGNEGMGWLLILFFVESGT